MFQGLHHFNLIVSDLTKTKVFYHESLGLEIALETTIEDAEFSRGVGLPGTKVLAAFFKLPHNPGLIETFQYLHPKGNPIQANSPVNNSGWQHLCFQVSDIEKTFRTLKAKGVEFLSTPVKIAATHPVFAEVRFCYFLGPDREVLELLQLP